METHVIECPSPMGPFWMQARDGALVAAGWRRLTGVGPVPLLEEAAGQVAAYFGGRLTRFDLPFRVEVGGIVPQVCVLMQAIPFGQTRTYGDLARDLAKPAQAIGQACGRNPIPLIIPCHRVLGASGLGGFSAAGGVETKVALLRIEGAASLLI
ncbi:methylated-DNA--[protein]-cysteine S-methyltransferase [Pseudooceanicola nitratireducens]|uniref:methylated-DNA--[protein]-cysteine S-methyltransferase n=1 Tax=Pseudooceanicola nitratireducens TaxID=517719 RepID=UPI003516135D